MNTSNFKTEANRLACKTENELRSICGIGEFAVNPPSPVIIPLAPLTEAELATMNALLATFGRGEGGGSGLTDTQKLLLETLMKRYVANGGVDPRIPVTDPGTGPNNGSFATHSIDNIWDLLNFCKASAVILLGSSLHTSLIIPANIIVFASFIYATRKSIFKFL